MFGRKCYPEVRSYFNGLPYTSRCATATARDVKMTTENARRRGRVLGGGAKGFSLVELLVTIAIAAIVLVIAIPSFNALLVRNRLRSAAETMRSEINMARSEALKRRQNVVVSFSLAGDGSWCYGLRVGATSCDCTTTSGATACYLDVDGSNAPVLRVTKGTQFRDITMDELPFGGDLVFSSVRPSVTAGNISFSSPHSQTVQIVTNDVGRVRLCSPSTARLYYFEEC